ncbi:hypothetical protein OBBRIDRAFT_807262 [Obba rivulosa]|uniref:Uncharacterized protein n=1 Tax=Obba rivulosa TaxID=1052685 RepID=A0A8E2AJP3_9APHY|nr:hypothetical protein OBBRIDRAFT_807262 [Obba rivulosa]
MVKIRHHRQRLRAEVGMGRGADHGTVCAELATENAPHGSFRVHKTENAERFRSQKMPIVSNDTNLYKLNQGLPLWEPEPTHNGHALLGDVGFVQEDRFYRFFTTLRPANDGVNRVRFVAGRYERYKSAQAFQRLRTMHDHGAVLVSNDRADREIVLQNNIMQKYMIEHHAAWCQFTKIWLGLVIRQEDIIFGDIPSNLEDIGQLLELLSPVDNVDEYGGVLSYPSMNSPDALEDAIRRLQRKIRDLELIDRVPRSRTKQLETELGNRDLFNASLALSTINFPYLRKQAPFGDGAGVGEELKARTDARIKLFCSLNRAGNALCA